LISCKLLEPDLKFLLFLASLLILVSIIRSIFGSRGNPGAKIKSMRNQGDKKKKQQRFDKFQAVSRKKRKQKGKNLQKAYSKKYAMTFTRNTRTHKHTHTHRHTLAILLVLAVILSPSLYRNAKETETGREKKKQIHQG